MRSYAEVQDDFLVMIHMNCKPETKKPRVGDVIDEDKSVKWNREEVERRIIAYEDEVKFLNRQKNARRDELINEMCEIIKHDVGGISLNDARQIWDYAYATKDDIVSVFVMAEELSDLVASIVHKKNDKKK